MKFIIAGMGPGHSDYVLPAARKALESAEVIIGGKRHIAPYEGTEKLLFQVEGQLTKLPQIIKTHKETKKIVVAVSGDTGFYSLLSYLRKHFEKADFDVIPGISSLQYMYGRIGRVHQNSFMGSVHGRDLDYVTLLETNETVGLLTDKINTPQNIAQKLVEAGKPSTIMYVGENLSYADEVITKKSANEIVNMTFTDLNVVIIERTDNDE